MRFTTGVVALEFGCDSVGMDFLRATAESRTAAAYRFSQTAFNVKSHSVASALRHRSLPAGRSVVHSALQLAAKTGPTEFSVGTVTAGLLA